MSALTRLLFPAPAEVRSTASIFRWWERRRPTFNVIVGATGIVTVLTVKAILSLPPISEPGPSLAMLIPGVLAYGLFANLFYSLGFVTEAAMQRAWHDDTPRVGPALFRQGLTFSVGLTLLPIALAGIGWGFSVFGWLLR